MQQYLLSSFIAMHIKQTRMDNIFFPLFLQCTSNRLGWDGAMSSCPPHFLPCTLSSNVGSDGTAQDAGGNVNKKKKGTILLLMCVSFWCFHIS
jgi:hypothetical protein